MSDTRFLSAAESAVIFLKKEKNIIYINDLLQGVPKTYMHTLNNYKGAVY